MTLLLWSTLFCVLLAAWILYHATVRMATGQPSLKEKLLLSGSVLLVPLGALGFYNEFGSPQLPAKPFESSVMANNPKNLGEALVQAQVLSYRNPHDAHALKNLADFYLANGYWLDAMQTYNRLIAQHGATAEKKISALPQTQALRHFIAANMDLLEKRVDETPQDPQAWMMLIRAYHFLKNREQQRSACVRAKNLLTKEQAAGLTVCSIVNTGSNSIEF